MTDWSDQKLDDLLRSNFKGAVPDQGFSARVTRALPTRQRRRPWLLPSAALAGGLLTWLALLPAPLWHQVTQEWLTGTIGAPSAIVGALMLGVSLLGVGWALEEAP